MFPTRALQLFSYISIIAFLLPVWYESNKGIPSLFVFFFYHISIDPPSGVEVYESFSQVNASVSNLERVENADQEEHEHRIRLLIGRCIQHVQNGRVSVYVRVPLSLYACL